MGSEDQRMTIEIRPSSSPEETERIASALAMRVAPGTVITLEGDLGAGKTCFVRGLARGLGADPGAISSPTFVIEHRHPCDAGSLVHIDAYRIRSAEDLASIGWDELLAEGSAVVAVEWPSRIEAALPAVRIDVRIRHVGEDAREIEIEWRRPGERAVACRACGAALGHSGGDGRFCSERCRMADLGRWFRGDYAIGRPIEEDDLSEDIRRAPPESGR
jgi:tRNA threonylcarbamoyladenosine biosynthesis protein TsaE